jgi:hypoxanthine phosphoribosyltransferase
MASRNERKKGAAKLLSIPSDVVLAPQAEAPRVPGPDRSRRNAPVKELSWAQFDRMVQKLAREVAQKFRPQAVVGVAHGGVFVGGALARALGADFFPVRISRRSRAREIRSAPKLWGAMPAELKGKTVLIVDDVCSSGDTLALAEELAKKVGAKQSKTAVLIAREGPFSPDFIAQESEELFVFPWDYELVLDESFWPERAVSPSEKKPKKSRSR